MINKFLDGYYLRTEALKKSLGDVFYYNHTKAYVAAMVALNAFLWIGARYVVSLSGEDQIALHYNVDAGIDYYGQAGSIYIMPVFGSIIILANFLIFWSVSRSKERKFLSHILLSNALVANIVIMTGLYTIYLVNFR